MASPITPDARAFDESRIQSTVSPTDQQETLQGTPSPARDLNQTTQTATPVQSPLKSTSAGTQGALGHGPPPLAPPLPTDLNGIVGSPERAERTERSERTMSPPVYRHSQAQRIVSAPVVPNAQRPLPVPGAQNVQPQYPQPRTPSKRPFELSPAPQRQSPTKQPVTPRRGDQHAVELGSPQPSIAYPGQNPPPLTMKESYSAQQLRQFQQSELQRVQPTTPSTPASPEQPSSAPPHGDHQPRDQPPVFNVPVPPSLVGSEHMEEVLQDGPKSRYPDLPTPEMDSPSQSPITPSAEQPARHPRKTSFTTRIGALVSRTPKSRSVSASAAPESTTEKEQTPTSPKNGVSRFIKGFGRKPSGMFHSPPTSPRVDEEPPSSPAPSLPPKEGGPQSPALPPIPSPLASTGPRMSPRRVPVPMVNPPPAGPVVAAAGGAGTGPGAGVNSPASSFSANGYAAPPLPVPVTSSPSAKRALAEVSQRSVRDESAIQERFRRDTEAKERLLRTERESERAVPLRSESEEGNVHPYPHASTPGTPAAPATPATPAMPLSPTRPAPPRPDGQAYRAHQSPRSPRSPQSPHSHHSGISGRNERPLSAAADYARSIRGRGSGIYDSVYDQEYSLEYAKPSPVSATFAPDIRAGAPHPQLHVVNGDIDNGDGMTNGHTGAMASQERLIDGDSPDKATTGVAAAAAAAVATTAAAATAAVSAAGHALTNGSAAPATVGEGEPHQGLQRETAADEQVADQLAQMDLAEDGQAGGTAVDMSMQAEAHARAMGEHRDGSPALNGGDPSYASPSYASEATLPSQHGEMQRIAEQREAEQRAEAEHLEAQRLQAEERERYEAEQRRIQAEQRRLEEERRWEEEQRRAEQMRLAEQRRLAEEAELRRLEEERRQHEWRLAEEKRLKEEREEEERRIARERQEEIERQRQAAFARLHSAKARNEMMLEGVSRSFFLLLRFCAT